MANANNINVHYLLGPDCWTGGLLGYWTGWAVLAARCGRMSLQLAITVNVKFAQT